MKTRFISWITGSLVAVTLMVGPAPAAAQLEACGDIHVEANAMCEVMVEGGCTTMCEPLSFNASCAADLRVGCEGSCDISAEASCTASCDVAACEARCEVDPGAFECHAECTANLSATCSARCEGMAGGGEARARCESSCEASFSAECDASCSARPPSANCTARCEASCEGSCTAEANIDCQVDCQADGYVDCYAELMGGCMTHCTEPDGALFCDGQYVDHGGNLDACMDALRDTFDIEVDASARGSAMCSGSSCTAEGEAEVSCAVGWQRPSRGGAAAGGLFAMLGLIVLGRRRKSQRS